MSSIHIKIQIINNNQIAIGPGKASLLEAIKLKGSISAAAASMGMSYKRAWDLVNVMNNSFNSPLVSTLVGGNKGGGAQVTDFGSQVLTQYRAVELKANAGIKGEMALLQAMLTIN